MSGVVPRVTWLLPVRNGMPYLPQTLASIGAQTYRDWEVLAWDNGSTDGSLEVLRRWIPASLPGRVISGRPLGLGACLAAMVEESRTDLLARIDADDVNEPQRLAEQLALLDTRPDLVAVGSWMQAMNAAGVPTALCDYPPPDPYTLRWVLFFANYLCHPTMCMRRVTVLRAGNYADMTPGQDYDLWLRLVQHGPIANVPRPLVRYRQHEQTVGARHHQEWAALARRLAMVYAPALFPGVPADDAMRLWDFESHYSPTCRRNPPPPALVFALARAASAQAGWPPQALTQLPMVLVLAARCAPWSPRGLWWRLRAVLRRYVWSQPPPDPLLGKEGEDEGGDAVPPCLPKGGPSISPSLPNGGPSIPPSLPRRGQGGG